jgi:hypothetical protein
VSCQKCDQDRTAGWQRCAIISGIFGAFVAIHRPLDEKKKNGTEKLKACNWPELEASGAAGLCHGISISSERICIFLLHSTGGSMK